MKDTHAMPGRRIPSSDDELLGECDVEVFRSSGPGGQNVNRRETAVRLRHRPSGVVVVCQDERTQGRNKQIALARLRAKLEKVYRRRKPRIPTRKPRAAREREIQSKKRHGKKKQLRGRVRRDD